MRAMLITMTRTILTTILIITITVFVLIAANPTSASNFQQIEYNRTYINLTIFDHTNENDTISEYHRIRNKTYTRTNESNVREFMTYLPPIDLKGANRCSPSSRYIAFAAKEHNLSFGTCNICTQSLDQKSMCGGHAINVIKLDDGSRLYTSNKNLYDREIYTYSELLKVINEWQQSNYKTLGMKSYWDP